METDSAYKKIVEAMQAVNANRTFKNIGTPEREDLDKAALLLEELSWEVVSEDIAEFAERMGVAVKELKSLTARIEKSYEHLKSIAAIIGAAADAVGLVAGTAAEII
jgi:rubrerythrin